MTGLRTDPPLLPPDLFDGLHIGDRVDVAAGEGRTVPSHVVSMGVELTLGERPRAWLGVIIGDSPRADLGAVTPYRAPVGRCTLVQRNALGLADYAGPADATAPALAFDVEHVDGLVGRPETRRAAP